MTFVRPDVQAVLDMLAKQPGPQMHEVDPATARQMMRMMGQLAERPRGDIAMVRDLTIPAPEGHAIPARLYAASKTAAPGPVLVYFHGGGWVIGDLETHDPLCAEIARGLGVPVVSVDYRLAPEAPFPAAVNDAFAACRWIMANGSALGHEVTGLVVAGDSAGGNLAAVCARELHQSLPVVAQWLIYPGVDMAASGGSMDAFGEGYLLTHAGMAWFMNHYMGPDPDLAHPHASPLHGERFDGLPSALIFTCALDPLRDQGRAYAAQLVSHGVPTRFREAAGQIHGCLNLRGAIPSAQADLEGCLADLRAMLAEARA